MVYLCTVQLLLQQEHWGTKYTALTIPWFNWFPTWTSSFTEELLFLVVEEVLSVTVLWWNNHEFSLKSFLRDLKAFEKSKIIRSDWSLLFMESLISSTVLSSWDSNEHYMVDKSVWHCSGAHLGGQVKVVLNPLFTKKNKQTGVSIAKLAKNKLDTGWKNNR